MKWIAVALGLGLTTWTVSSHGDGPGWKVGWFPAKSTSLDQSATLNDRQDRESVWREQQSHSQASLRGVCAVDQNVAWASGSQGTCLRTVDGGATWEIKKVPDADQLDFRDIHALDDQTAWLLTAGKPAKILVTRDGGASWQQQYENQQEGIFFDAIDFWDSQHGIAFSDPIDGRLVIVITDNGGRTWNQVPADQIPPALEGEAGFAASGTCLVVQGQRHVWIGLGGPSAARVFYSQDRGKTWSVVETPMTHGSASRGIFSLTFWDAAHGIAVGGDYQHPDQTRATSIRTSDGGKTWQLMEDSAPRGYRSAVAYVPGTQGPAVVAVGKTGTDYSEDGGLNWQPLSDQGYYAVSFSKVDGTGWAVGSEGRIARWVPPTRQTQQP